LKQLLALALTLFATRPVTAEEVIAPSVDLDKIQLHSDHATAPAGALDAALTLDVNLHAQALRLLRAARPVQGAAVAIDVRTARVLAWAEYKSGDQTSLLYTPTAPAASLFKLVTTVALFEHAHLHPQRKICIDGGQHGIYRRHLDPARGPDAHCSPFFQALGHSRNAVYAQLASHHLMRNDLLEVAETLGFNRPLPFDVPVPLGSLKVPYNDLLFARAAAGFIDSKLTPLGAAYLAFLVANGGRAARLSIVDHAGDYRAPAEKQNLDQVFSTNSAWRLVRMMEVTVHSGTSLGAFSDERGRSYLRSVRVAGKTGTLQLSKSSPTTSWFTGFAPSRQPRIVVAVLLQNGHIWHRKANEVARDVLRHYFSERGAPGVSAP
jgi:cell division protein FtsI/penicillin-binding protein 2